MSALALAPRPLRLRVADEADVELVWSWNNAPDVRASSKDPRPIELDRHRAWFARRISSRDPMWIVEEYDVPVGVVRIDRRGATDFISIALGRAARGRGLGQLAIRTACIIHDAPVTAEIRPTNTASRACFTSCGFRLLTEDAELAVYRWTPGG